MRAELDPLEADVVVVGAGAAGITTAIAAARNGARTILLEYQGFLGGVSATLPWLGFHDREYRQVVKGLPAEFVTKLQEMGGAGEITLDPKCGSLVSIHGHYWKILAMRLAREAGVTVLFHTHVVDTLREGDRITGVVVEHKSGTQRVRGAVVVDCSGDGDVAARGGVAWEKGRTADGLVQAPTLVFRLAGIDNAAFKRACQTRELNYREWLAPYPNRWEKMSERLDEVETYVLGGFASTIERARSNGDVEFPQTRIVGVKVHTPESPDEFHVVMTRVLGLDPTDVFSLSGAYAKVYEQIPQLVRFFREYVPGFEHAHLKEIAPMLGIRESRRIMGDYVLTLEDVVSGRRHDDGVAMGGYHVDIHRPSGTWVESYNVDAYTIPLRSLIARDVEGLMMAGKCLSATHEGVASTRVIPICMAQGQAVGTAAALAVARGETVRDLPIRLLQDRLIDQGAEIGETLEDATPEILERWPVLPKEEPPTTGEADAASATEVAWIR